MSAPSSPHQESGEPIMPLRIKKSQQTQRKIFEALQDEKTHKTKVSGTANTRNIRSFWNDLEKNNDKFTPKPPQSNVYNSPNPQFVNSSPHFSSLEFREGSPGYEPPPGSLGRPLKQVIRRANSNSRLHGPREFSPQPGSPSSDYGSPPIGGIDEMLETPVVKQEFEPIGEYEEYHGDANYEVKKEKQEVEKEVEQETNLSRLVSEEANLSHNLTRSKSKKNVTFNMEPPSIVMYETLTPELGPESPLMHSDEEFSPHEDDDLHVHHPVIEPGFSDFYNDDIITPISAPRRPLPMIPQVDLVDSESDREEEHDAPLPVDLDSPSMDNSVKAVFSQRSLSDNKLNMIENTIDDAHQVSLESASRASVGPDSKEYIREALIDHQLPEESPMVGSFSEYEQGQYEAQFDHNGRLVIPVNLARKESLLDNERKISTKHHVPTIDSHSDETAQLTRRVSQRRRSVIKALENESKPAAAVINEEEEETEGGEEESEEESEEEEFQDSEEMISEGAEVAEMADVPSVVEVAAVASTVGVAEESASVHSSSEAAAESSSAPSAVHSASAASIASTGVDNDFQDSKEEFSFSEGLNEALKNEYEGDVHLSQILPDELSEQARDMSDVPGEPHVSAIETPVPLPPVESEDWSSSFSHVTKESGETETTGEVVESSRETEQSSGEVMESSEPSEPSEPSDQSSFGQSFNQTTTELHPEERSVVHNDAPTDEEEEEDEEQAADVAPAADASVMFARSVRGIKTEVVDDILPTPTVKDEPVDFDEILADIPRGDLSGAHESGRFSFGPETSFSVKKADETLDEFVPAVPEVPVEHLTSREVEQPVGDVLTGLNDEEEEAEEEEAEEEDEAAEADTKSLAESTTSMAPLSQTTTRDSAHVPADEEDLTHSDIESETPLLVSKLRQAAPQYEDEDTAPVTVSSFSDFSLPQHRDFTPLMGFESPAEQDSPMKTTGILTSGVKGEKRDITPFFPKMEELERGVPNLSHPSQSGDDSGRYDEADESAIHGAHQLIHESEERQSGVESRDYDFGSERESDDDDESEFESESPVKGEFVKSEPLSDEIVQEQFVKKEVVGHEHVPIKPEPQFEFVEPEVERGDVSRDQSIGMMTALNDSRLVEEAGVAEEVPPMPPIPAELEHAVSPVLGNQTVDVPVLPVAEMERTAEAAAEAVVSQATPSAAVSEVAPSSPAPVTPVVSSEQFKSTTPRSMIIDDVPETTTPRSMIIDDVPVEKDAVTAKPIIPVTRDRMSVPRVPVGGAGGAGSAGSAVPGAVGAGAVAAGAVVPAGAGAVITSVAPAPSLPTQPSQVGLMTMLQESEPDESHPPRDIPPVPSLPDILPAELSGVDDSLEDDFDPDATPESVNVSRSLAAPVIPTPNLPTPNFHTPLSNFGVSPDMHHNSIVPEQVSVLPEWTEGGEEDMTAPGVIAVGADLGDVTQSAPSSAGDKAAPVALPAVPTPALPAVPGEDHTEDHTDGRFDSAYTTGRFDSADEGGHQIKKEFSQYSLSLDHSPESQFGDQFKQYDVMQDIPVKEEYVPEDQQTIKMHGRNNSIRARKSLAHDEVSRFTHARRKVSGDFGLGYNDTMRDLSSRGSDDYDDHLQREISQTPIKLPAPKLEFSIEDLTEDTESMFADLESEFDRVISVQKRGYSLRENNRIVIANGPAREINRRLSGPVKKWDGGSNVAEPTPEMPPMPEQYRSMVDDVAPSAPAAAMAKTVPAPAAQIRSKKTIPSSQRMPTVESGRLFVRLLGLKDLDLPGVDSKNAVLSLTMDNGIHCITTPYESLRKSTRLDQEFELTVEKDLEFILTLRTRWKRKSAPMVAPQVQRRPSNSSMSAKNKLGKLFGKKSDPRLNSHVQSAPAAPADPWDALTAKDGSFGRSYIAFAQYEQEIYGKPGVFEVNCFNEWTEVNGKKRQPYKIAKLEIELMYIPRGSKSETLPVSIEAAQETLKEASVKTQIETEGFMSQHGGDCKYWRRRYFTLRGTTLTAYSETSRKPRATINLAKAVAVIADKSALSQPTVEVGRDKQRRKSVFAAESDGFMFANEGLRLRFANGEIIDFYADSEETKDSWVSQLRKVVGTQAKAQPWVDLVLARREYEKNTMK